MTSERESKFAAGGYVGGYVGGAPALVTIHPDECLIRITKDRPVHCVRAEHPTQTSDCATETWIVHESRSAR